MLFKIACISFLLEISLTISSLRNAKTSRHVLKRNDLRRFRQGAMRFFLTHGPFRKSDIMTPLPDHLFNQLQETYVKKNSPEVRRMISNQKGQSKTNPEPKPTLAPVTEPNLSYDYDSDSEVELAKFKNNFKMSWIAKQNEAKNTSENIGDIVNMVGARPWGVECGDPNQHDVPWGTCVLSVECEAESRIYRGDIFCGRTSFVCCVLMIQDTEWDHVNYPQYMSFEDSGLTTDSQEKRERASKKLKIRMHRMETKKMKHENQKKLRKRRIKRMIKKIANFMSTLFTKIYQNNSRQRFKALMKYKKVVGILKKEYLKDKMQTIMLHDSFIRKIYDNTYKSLQQVMDANINFIRNSTFAKIMSTRAMSVKEEKMLLEAYPELEESIRANQVASAVELQLGQNAVPSRRSEPTNRFNYDVEYGFLYY